MDGFVRPLGLVSDSQGTQWHTKLGEKSARRETFQLRVVQPARWRDTRTEKVQPRRENEPKKPRKLRHCLDVAPERERETDAGPFWDASFVYVPLFHCLCAAATVQRFFDLFEPLLVNKRTKRMRQTDRQTHKRATRGGTKKTSELNSL